MVNKNMRIQYTAQRNCNELIIILYSIHFRLRIFYPTRNPTYMCEKTNVIGRAAGCTCSVTLQQGTCSTHGLAVRDIRQKYRKYKKNSTHQPDDLALRETVLSGLAKQKICNNSIRKHARYLDVGRCLMNGKARNAHTAAAPSECNHCAHLSSVSQRTDGRE
jgi:hypothetical protein